MMRGSGKGRWSRREVVKVLLASPFVLSTAAKAQSSAKYEFGVAGIDPIYSAPYVAFKKGYFKEAGIDVGHLNSQSGPRTKQILTAGQVLVGCSGVNDALATTVAGKPTTVVFGLDRRITYANILIRKEDAGKFKSIADLSGQRLAVTQLQSATWLMAVFIAEKGGAKDVDIRGLGDFDRLQPGQRPPTGEPSVLEEERLSHIACRQDERRAQRESPIAPISER